jgi:NitT/TauT family transport system permease protein/taurine transport system permease protein
VTLFDLLPSGPATVRSRVMAALWFVVPFVALACIWWAAVAWIDPPARIFPQIDGVWDAAVRLTREGVLGQHVWASLQRVLIGAGIAVVTGVPFGILLGSNRYVAAFFSPLLRFSVALAGIAWIPLATLWFGYGEGAVVFIISNAVFFALVYNAALGVSRIPQEMQRAARSLGAGPVRMLWEVMLPGALPSIVTGLRVGLGYGWRGLIAAEIIATNLGLGYALFLAQKYFETDVIILSMIIIGALWLVMDRLLLAPLERRTVERWGTKRATAR